MTQLKLVVSQCVVAAYASTDRGGEPQLHILGLHPRDRLRCANTLPLSLVACAQDGNVRHEQLLDSHPSINLAAELGFPFDSTSPLVRGLMLANLRHVRR
jgi:hypothetical protein